MVIPRTAQRGFTLIELSIVLVIIGLIVGGVLVGQDLIRAAGVRATISQIEKYNMAVNTFRGKYDAFPGDMNAAPASQFGFTPRGQYAGEGDGDGVLEGVTGNGIGANWGWVQGAGETVMFWVDLTSANGLNVNFIEGSFSAATPTSVPGATVTGAALGNYFPSAKLGGGNYFYVYSNNYTGAGNSINYFGLSAVTILASNVGGGCNWCVGSNPGLTVQSAYAIDKKIDDGLPTSGNVIAQYLDGIAFGGASIGNPPNGAASSTTCYDNGGPGGTQEYSVKQNGGAGVNCALSFRFQ